jgi:ribosomal protein L37AE/L43A
MKKKRTRKLAPWEEERRRIRKTERQRLYRAGLLKIDPSRSFGRVIGQKAKKNITEDDMATFSCPSCHNTLRVDLIRLRQDFYECRKCGHNFSKENVFESFDFEGI